MARQYTKGHAPPSEGGTGLFRMSVTFNNWDTGKTQQRLVFSVLTLLNIFRNIFRLVNVSNVRV